MEAVAEAGNGVLSNWTCMREKLGRLVSNRIKSILLFTIDCIILLSYVYFINTRKWAKHIQVLSHVITGQLKQVLTFAELQLT